MEKVEFHPLTMIAFEILTLSDFDAQFSSMEFYPENLAFDFADFFKFMRESKQIMPTCNGRCMITDADVEYFVENVKKYFTIKEWENQIYELTDETTNLLKENLEKIYNKFGKYFNDYQRKNLEEKLNEDYFKDNLLMKLDSDQKEREEMQKDHYGFDDFNDDKTPHFDA